MAPDFILRGSMDWLVSELIRKTDRSVIYPPKIICPNTAKIIHRAHLFKALDDARQHAKIIWIAAPGGSGKTTLVSHYLEKNQIAHCWYQVDEDDRDLATFFHYLGLAGKLASPRRKKSIPKLTPEYQQGVSAFTRLFFKEISSRLKGNGLIVLDNFQLLSETDPIPALLPTIVESLSPGISLLIISRHLPPPSTLTFSARRQLQVIDSNLMRFVKDEWLAASELFNTQHSEKELLSLHQKLDGWIAGLVLLPDTANVLSDTNTSSLGIEMLDGYIAEQFLSSLDEKTSELLMKVCYMPHITAEAAKAVSHIGNSKELLASLAQKNLFVLQHGEKGYTLHPLVREYLKHRAQERLTKQELYNIHLLTAVALLAEKECEAAADLLLEIEAWQELVNVILNCAAELYDSGRIEALKCYMDALPNAFAECDPWLNYWRGKLAAYNDAFLALDCFDQAYVIFLKRKDVTGIYMAWYSAVSIICLTLLGGECLVTWVNRYNEFTVRYPEPPKTLQKEFVDSILLQSYFFSGLDPKKRESLRARLVVTIDNATDPLVRLNMISNYVVVAIISGVQEKDRVILDKFENQLEEMKDNPVLHLGALTYCSLSVWAFNDFEKLLSLEWRAYEIAKESGISVFDFHIYTKIVIAALGLNKFDLARKYINILKENITDKDPVHQSLYLTCLIAAGTCMEEFSELDETIEYYFKILESTHFPAFILQTKLSYVYYLCEKNRSESAMALHDDLLMLAEKLALPAQLSRYYMIYAKVLFNLSEFDRSELYLRKSFSIARENALITYTFWNPELMKWACQQAFLFNIEVAYVTRFVEIHYANLPQPTSKCQQWPWPFRVYTFGRFELKMRDGVSHQMQQVGKSFTLLRTLAKAQGQQLTNEAIKNTLYSSDENAKASQLLDTQIHRLRKSLGNDQAILRQGNNVKLHLKYFWIDVREFESLGKWRVTQENALMIARRLQDLYQGEYLPDDETIEVIAYRERYRNIYLATLFKCLDHIEINTNKAIELCQNALVLEPLSEPLYRKLITIYLRQNNRDMAEVTLEQCRKLVREHLSCDLSSETLSLLKENCSASI